MRTTALGLLTGTRYIDLENQHRIECLLTLPLVKLVTTMVADVGACQY